MKKVILYSFILLAHSILGVGCDAQSNKNQANTPKATIRHNDYAAMTLPRFFEQLSENHYQAFYQRDSALWNSACQEKNIDIKNLENIKTVFKLNVLHKLFTSRGASNGTRGQILNIPYFWHWVKPNPRHEIKWVETNQNLTAIPPDKAFSKYKSIADIDRTPYLFLADLVKDKPSYFHTSCDTFATFGWCSEREMAFVCLAELLGYQGKVVASGNHSWSEFIVKLQNKENKQLDFCISIDNTFGYFNILSIKKTDIPEWNNYFGNAPLSKWYNQKAHESKEQTGIKTCIVASPTAAKIEQAINRYLTQK